MVLRAFLMWLVGAFLPKRVGIKIIIYLLEWAAKKTKYEWDDKLVDVLKKSI